VSWRRAGRILWDVIHDISMAVIVVVFFVTFVAQAFRVQGTSMMPLLHDGERIVVDKLTYRLRDIRRGEVVVFWYPLDPSVSFIKRVVGLPGETIEIHDGVLFVNGRRIKEPYLVATFRDHDDLGPVEVRRGHYFVMGDHRNGSNDSRSWGDVPAKYIYGRAAFRFWPLARMGWLN
jgi:signal peptidase I